MADEISKVGPLLRSSKSPTTLRFSRWKSMEDFVPWRWIVNCLLHHRYLAKTFKLRDRVPWKWVSRFLKKDMFIRESSAYRRLKEKGFRKRGVIPDSHGTIMKTQSAVWPHLHMFSWGWVASQRHSDWVYPEPATYGPVVLFKKNAYISSAISFTRPIKRYLWNIMVFISDSREEDRVL